METEGRARENWREREGFEMLNEKRMTASAQKLEKKKVTAHSEQKCKPRPEFLEDCMRAETNISCELFVPDIDIRATLRRSNG